MGVKLSEEILDTNPSLISGMDEMSFIMEDFPLMTEWSLQRPNLSLLTGSFPKWRQLDLQHHFEDIYTSINKADVGLKI